MAFKRRALERVLAAELRAAHTMGTAVGFNLLGRFVRIHSHHAGHGRMGCLAEPLAIANWRAPRSNFVLVLQASWRDR